MKALVIDLGRHSIRSGLVTDEDRLIDVQSDVFPSKPGLKEYIRKVEARRHITLREMALIIAAPGPFKDDKFAGLKMPGWEFTVGELREAFSDRVMVLHDVLGGALGIKVQRNFRRIFGSNEEPVVAIGTDSPRAFIQTGIGLGVAALLPQPDGSLRPFSGEGGSSVIAPWSEDEDNVFRYFRENPGKWEFASAQALLSTESLPRYSEPLGGAFENAKPEDIVHLARSGDEKARRALNVYAGFLGSFAGDVALMFRAYDGLSIAGYVPNALDQQAIDIFLYRFRERGPAGDQLLSLPIEFVFDPNHTLAGLGYLVSTLNWES